MPLSEVATVTDVFSFRIMDLAKLMGLTMSKSARRKADETELTDEHKHASLVLPLVKYEPLIDRRKRKKMR